VVAAALVRWRRRWCGGGGSGLAAAGLKMMQKGTLDPPRPYTPSGCAAQIPHHETMKRTSVSVPCQVEA